MGTPMRTAGAASAAAFLLLLLLLRPVARPRRARAAAADDGGCSPVSAADLPGLSCGVAEDWRCRWNVTEAVAATARGLTGDNRSALEAGLRSGDVAAAVSAVLRAPLRGRDYYSLRSVDEHLSAGGSSGGRTCGVVVRSSDVTAAGVRAAAYQAELIREWLPDVPIALDTVLPAGTAVDSGPFSHVFHSGLAPSPGPFDRALVLAVGVVPIKRPWNPSPHQTFPTLPLVAGLLDLLRWHDVVAPPAVEWDYEYRNWTGAEQPLQPRVLAIRRSACADRMRACWARLQADGKGQTEALAHAVRATPVKAGSVGHMWRWVNRPVPGEEVRRSACVNRRDRAHLNTLVLFDDLPHVEDRGRAG